ncbi:hypothetical protein KCP77_07640 [Salmonella enterica subsp. enterica]|nr:hypothetical protein KCP77_07640 [Salmonella enterica subsp. enterica]
MSGLLLGRDPAGANGRRTAGKPRRLAHRIWVASALMALMASFVARTAKAQIRLTHILTTRNCWVLYSACLFDKLLRTRALLGCPDLC